MAKVYSGDIGTDIVLDTLVPLATATLLSIKVKEPNGTTTTWSGTLDSTTKIKHTLVLGDTQNKHGTFKLQSYAEFPGWSGLGETVDLEVYPAFE